jgi:hypothetical protein
VIIDFVRSDGVELAIATPRAVSDDDGFFALRSPALQEGSALGELRVQPPPPYVPYTIPDVALRTHRVRGDGMNAGRLVVNPYVFMVGRVYDRRTREPIAGATVTIERLSGARATEDTRTFQSDVGGQFSWQPALIDLGMMAMEVRFTISAPGEPREYTVLRDVPVSHRDVELSVVLLPVGWGLAYSAGTLRRGSNEILPGVVVEFQRLSGIVVAPEATTLPVDPLGGFPFTMEPLEEGALVGELRIIPPPPFPPETTRVVLQTSDDDVVEGLGWFGYGAQLAFAATLRAAGSGAALPDGTVVSTELLAGPPLAWRSAPADSGLRRLDDEGTFTYQAPTADSGASRVRLVARLPAPFAWDTLLIDVPAAYSDSVYQAGTLAVRLRPR